MAKRYEYRIHPAVGVARMGNSTSTYFLTAEKPRQPVDPQKSLIPGKTTPGIGTQGEFRDASGKLAKQGARFRVFCYEFEKTAAGWTQLDVWECNSNEYDIEWTVQVANLKSTLGGNIIDTRDLTNRRPNQPAPVTLKTNVPAEVGTESIFRANPSNRLDLGSCFVDTNGRLIVLGSDGVGRNLPGSTDRPETGGVNLHWPGWEDDAADGPVTAKIKAKSSSTKRDKSSLTSLQSVDRSAWVVVSIPDYGADVRASVSLYALALENGYVSNGLVSGSPKLPKKEQYQTWINQVEPIFDAYIGTRFVMAAHSAYYVHANAGIYTSSWPKYSKLDPRKASPSKTAYYASFRVPYDMSVYKPENIFVRPSWFEGEDPTLGARTGNPSKVKYTSSDSNMPKLKFTSPTSLQHEALALWAAGKLGSGVLKSRYSGQTKFIPYQLDRAHMESMNGRSLFPGIEVGREVNYPRTWVARPGSCKDHLDVRIVNEVEHGSDPSKDGQIKGPAQPGYLSRSLACPWHSDFYLCDNTYWPHSRPDTVMNAATHALSTPARTYDWASTSAGSMAPTTGSGSSKAAGPFLSDWWKLGFLRHDLGTGKILEKDYHSSIGRP